MLDFAAGRNIEIQTVPPRHPNSNPAENFMKPLGKAMKIGMQNNIPEKEILQEVLNSYRHTSHPKTGIAPADMMFRDGLSSNFPRKKLNDNDIHEARKSDLQHKLHNEKQVNSSKYRKSSEFTVGDQVLIRNYKRKSKFDTLFEKTPYFITNINDIGNKITVVRSDNLKLCRHPDDIKPFYGKQQSSEEVKSPYTDQEILYKQYENDDCGYECPFQQQYNTDRQMIVPDDVLHEEQIIRRSDRDRRQNRRYFNDDFDTNT